MKDSGVSMPEIDEFEKIGLRIEDDHYCGKHPKNVRLSAVISQALREVHERTLSGAEDFLVKHYWDSLEYQRDLLNLHIKACFSRLKKSKS